MKKQLIQFCVVIAVLVVCIGGYFGISKYFTDKEESESSDNIVAFEMENYADISNLTYLYGGETISLYKEDDKWYDSSDTSVNLSSSTIEDDMLAQLASVEATQKIESPEDIAEYGFETNEKGELDTTTNTIVFSDGDNTYTIYIGDVNPYDSTQYYMMVEGDDNVYVTDSTLSDAFYKSVEDITEEETTGEETTVEETTVEETTVEETAVEETTAETAE